MWWAQGVLHWKNTPIVPGGLLTIAISLVVYCHMTMSHMPHLMDPLKTFLSMIIVQMIPLVLLEIKIMSCSDPVGLFCKFAVPVTSIHAVFLGMRLIHYQTYETSYLMCSAAGLVGAIFTMFKGFHWSPQALFHHGSVWKLILFALAGACFSHWLELWLVGGINPFAWLTLMWRVAGHPNPHQVILETFAGDLTDQDLQYEIFQKFQGLSISPLEVLVTCNNYMEIMAFVPALWMVLREDKKAERVQVEEIDTKRTSSAFFLFLVGFYLSEDLLNSYDAWGVSGLATAGHLVHFLLLLDFACYILAHIYNPEKLMGELRKWLPVDLSYDV